MKRKKLLPADREKIDLIRPYRLKDDDLDKFKVTIAGFDFLVIGGVLLCPKCGQPQKLECQVALDDEVYWFLKFYCSDYSQAEAQLPANAVTPDATQPGGGSGNDAPAQ